MKKCPYCQKGNNDEEIQCWNCGEWFDILSPPQQGNVVKPPKKEQSGTDSVDWQTKLGVVLNKYRMLIISIIIIAGLLFTISQNANFNKNTEHVAGIEPPKIDAPAAPAPARASRGRDRRRCRAEGHPAAAPPAGSANRTAFLRFFTASTPRRSTCPSRGPSLCAW